MKRQPDAHLNPAEVEALARSGCPGSDSEEVDVTEARKHVARCTRCQFVLELQADPQSGFAESVPRPAAVRTAGCPRQDQWPSLAAGLIRGAEAEMLLSHAAACHYCGPLLRQALEDFAEEVTPGEEEFLAGLQSARPEWQQHLAARTAEEARTPWFRRRVRRLLRWAAQPLFPRIPVPAWAYSGLAVLLAMVAPQVVRIMNGPPVEDLLATAYTANRTLELRVPEAAYGQFRLVRGAPAISGLDRPPAQLDAEAKIARALAEKPNDPRWLQARARAELLTRNCESAIADLQRCVSLHSDSPYLMTDLAAAYFQRAEANNSEPDYRTAIEFLNRALARTPDDPVALFNRAIVYQRIHLYNQAIQCWRSYLRVDPDSQWAAEARQRLAAAQQALSLFSSGPATKR